VYPDRVLTQPDEVAMKTRTLALLLCLFASTTASEARNVFVLPGASSTTSAVFAGDPFAATGSIAAAPSTFQVLAHPAGTKYYAVSKSAVDTVLVYDASLTTILRRISIPTSVTTAALSPDGRRLVLVGTGVSIVDTTADLLLNIPAIDVGTNPIDVAISNDSNRAFVLSSASNRVTTIDLFGNTQLGNAVTIPGVSTGITRAPNDLLYVSAQNRIFEIDGRNQTIRNEIPLNESPGKISFTPDGARGIAVNFTPVTGSVLVVFETATRAVTRLTSQQLPSVTLDKVVVAGNNRALGISALSRILYDIGLNPTNGSIATLGVIGGFTAVADVAVSGEQPTTPQGSARYAYIAAGGTLTRVALTTNSPSGQLSLTGSPGGLAFAGPASTAAPVSFALFNANQTFSALQGPQALALRVVDANNLPVISVPVSFSSSAPGLVIQGQSTTTNGEGIAVTTVVLPAATGSGTVTATIAGGTLAGTFSLSISGGPAAGVPTTIEGAGGNGQVVLPNTKTNLPIAVVLRDGNGMPVPSSPVTWSLQGTGTLVDALTQTDVNGIATASFIGGSLVGGATSSQQTIIVGNSTISKTLYVTTSTTLPGVTFLAPAGENARIVSQAGQTIAGAVQVRLSQFFGNVGVRATANLPLAATEPSASCTTEAGLVLTDFAGTASCDLKVGPRTGTTNLTVNVGGYSDTTIALVVNPGPPAALRVIQGNNQAGLAGQELPLALVAEVADAFGNTLPGTAVEWEVVTPGTITLSNIFSRGDARGRVSALATLGNTGGVYQVRVKLGTAVVATFNLTVTIPFSQIVKVAGGEPQSATFDQQFAQPVTVQVNDNNGRAVAGIPVTFTASGPGSVGTGSVTTDAQGRASTTVRAGTTAGTLSIVAVAGSFSVTFNLTVLPPGPSLTASSFASAGSGAAGVTPGGLVTITGRGLAPDLRGTATANPLIGPAPTTLAGLTVSFNGTAAPILSVTNVQGSESAIVQAPFELRPGTASVRVEAGGTPVTIENVPVLANQPAILETVVGGRRFGVVLKSNGTYVSTTNPAAPREVLRLYATALGQVSPAAVTGRTGVPGQRLVNPIIVGVDNAGARVISAALAVNLVGVYEVDFEVPQEATAGAKTLVIALPLSDGSVAFSQNTLIAIQ
jgi:uncharacterized protein (TIGR03437 family)